MAAHGKDNDAERHHDQTVEDSFPASDPPANSGVVGPRGRHGHDAGRTPPDERSEDARPKGTPTHDRHATETAHVWENEVHSPSRR
ncbi:MAG TPA: hypothetical protein VMB71_00825 [Acetobacteraceae bacterium]|jgi:hypothetical protein|nr:hypothetical protein [Acetobacteraceae bacterium]